MLRNQAYGIVLFEQCLLAYIDIGELVLSGRD